MTTTPDLLAPLAPITTLARALSGPRASATRGCAPPRRGDRAARRHPRCRPRCRSTSAGRRPRVSGKRARAGAPRCILRGRGHPRAARVDRGARKRRPGAGPHHQRRDPRAVPGGADGLERGDLVAVDNPVFPLFLRALELSTDTDLPSESARAGSTSSSWPGVCATARIPRRCTPCPTSTTLAVTLPTEQRRELVGSPSGYGFTVFADNPYRELRFAGEDQGDTSSSTRTRDPRQHVHQDPRPRPAPGLAGAPDHLVDPVCGCATARTRTRPPSRRRRRASCSPATRRWFDATLVAARALYRNRAEMLVAALERRSCRAHSRSRARGRPVPLAPADGRHRRPRELTRAAPKGCRLPAGRVLRLGPGQPLRPATCASPTATATGRAAQGRRAARPGLGLRRDRGRPSG